MVVDQLIIYSLAIENAGLDTESTSGCQGRELIIWKVLNSLQLTTSCDNVAFFFIKAGYFSTASSSVAFSRRLIALAPSIRKHFIMVRLFFFLIAERFLSRDNELPPLPMQMRVGYGIRCFSWCIIRADLEKDAVEFTHACWLLYGLFWNRDLKKVTGTF